MISTWRIGNFKKFSCEISFDIKGLTFLSGANSSGKSSLLQSILLIKQTIMNSSPDRAMSLNGPLVQLGSFSDIANFSREDTAGPPQISIGWSMKRSQDDETGIFEDKNFYLYAVDSFDFDFKTSNAITKNGGVSSEMYPTLEESSISMIAQDEDLVEEKITSHLYSISTVRSSGIGRKIKYNHSLFDLNNDPTLYLVTQIDDSTSRSVKNNLSKARISGASFRNFFPSSIAVRYDRGLENRKKIKKVLTGGRITTFSTRNILMPPELMDKIYEIASSVFESAEQTRNIERAKAAFSSLSERVSLYKFHRAVREVHPSTKKRLLEAFEKEKASIDKILTKNFPTDLVLSRQVPALLELAPDIAASFFRFHVHYVGPLRDQPKPIYSSRQIQSSTDVGPSGEYTAAVLSLNEKSIVKYLAPETHHDGTISYIEKEGYLGSALSNWLSYLGIATDLTVSDRGSLGYELKVKTMQDDSLRDLTNVGVGVSQILPVLVTVLLAKPGSLILLEQPELHLHPRIQSRLCDFFLAASEMGKQLIVETHSEHIIERLRLRVAQSKSSAPLDNSIIYFFEDSEEIARKVEVTEYGAILNWPEGFFDESSNQSAEILSASMKKKIAKKSKPKGNVKPKKGELD